MDQPHYPQPASRSGPLLATSAGVDDAGAFGLQRGHTSGHLRLVSPEEAPSAASTTRWGPTSIGLDAQLAAGLGYLIGPLGVLFFFTEKRNRFLRFHCAQVILLAIVSVVLGTLWSGVITLESMTSGATSSTALALVIGVSACAFGLAYLALFGLWLWGMISGFTGKYTKLPVIGGIAVKWAGGAPVPAF